MSLPALCRLCACCDCRCDYGLLWYCNEKIIWKEFSRAFLKQLIEQLQQQARTLFISFNHCRVFKDIKRSLNDGESFFPQCKKVKNKNSTKQTHKNPSNSCTSEIFSFSVSRWHPWQDSIQYIFMCWASFHKRKVWMTQKAIKCEYLTYCLNLKTTEVIALN